MIDHKKVLALVPARGGSKGLPGKNIRPLNGKPLIGWSIEAGLASRYVDRVVATTDSHDIAEAARTSGADVPFLRPPELATDTATSVDVIEHAIRFLAEQGDAYDIVVLLEPTSPLRDAHDIDAALEQMQAAGADSIVSVCRAESTHPAFMFSMASNGALQSMQAEGFRVLRRQELAPAFFLDGSVYASRIEPLLRQRTFCQAGTLGFEVPKWKSPEIDDIVDFLFVEAIMKHRAALPDTDLSSKGET